MAGLVPADWAELHRTMAGRLHDEVAGGLHAIRWMIQSGLLSGPAAADAEACLLRVATATRSIEAELFPSLLLHGDLPMALRDLADRYSGSRCEIDPPGGSWPTAHGAHCLYRIAESALAATAGQTSCLLRLAALPDACRLQVIPGRLLERQRPGDPPWWCRERLEAWIMALGGRVERRVDAPEGPRIDVWLPVRADTVTVG